MAVTQGQIDAMEAAYYSPELRVTHDGRTTEYASKTDQWTALQNAKAQLESAAGTRRRKIHFTDAPRGW